MASIRKEGTASQIKAALKDNPSGLTLKELGQHTGILGSGNVRGGVYHLRDTDGASYSVPTMQNGWRFVRVAEWGRSTEGYVAVLRGELNQARHNLTRATKSAARYNTLAHNATDPEEGAQWSSIARLKLSNQLHSEFVVEQLTAMLAGSDTSG